MSRADDDPKRVDGRYIHGEHRGCRTCGWAIPNSTDPTNALWLAHDHDPMIDIKTRVLNGQTQLPVEDVVWLLAIVDPEQWARAGAA